MTFRGYMRLTSRLEWAGSLKNWRHQRIIVILVASPLVLHQCKMGGCHYINLYHKQGPNLPAEMEVLRRCWGEVLRVVQRSWKCNLRFSGEGKQ